MAQSDEQLSGDPVAYPEAAVQPILPNETTACNSQLPGGEVVEWFDFGQFVELMAVDDAGVSHPVVLANHEEIARAAGQFRQGDELPLRMVDVVGGIPLTEIADEGLGSGERALAPIPEAREIVVGDVDDLIRSGEIAAGGSTYRVTLTQDEARRLGDGEHITHVARLVEAGSTREVTVRLAPVVYDALVSDIEELLAARVVTVEIDKKAVRLELKLEPAEVTALLAGTTVIVRASTDERTKLVRLGQPNEGSGPQSTRPARAENTIADLAAFLVNPVVEGDDGRPYRLPLTKESVHDLLTTSTTTITLQNNLVVTVTVRKA